MYSRESSRWDLLGLGEGVWTAKLWIFPILVVPKGRGSSKLARLPACQEQGLLPQKPVDFVDARKEQSTEKAIMDYVNDNPLNVALTNCG